LSLMSFHQYQLLRMNNKDISVNFPFDGVIMIEIKHSQTLIRPAMLPYIRTGRCM
jgi:hypothetical protein